MTKSSVNAQLSEPRDDFPHARGYIQVVAHCGEVANRELDYEAILVKLMKCT